MSDISVMTEIKELQAQTLPAAVERFILHWGDMGGQWGVNRSVAQIHALLFLSAKPMIAEDIADQLGLARSNVSTSIKELVGWKLVRRIPVMGDRRDHFEAESDMFEMVRRIAAGRKEREIDPAVTALMRCVAEAEDDTKLDPVAAKRLSEMLEFLRTVDAWYADIMTVPTHKLMRLIRLGARVTKFLR